MSWLKGLRWWHWVLIAVVPGGAVAAVALRARARAAAAPRDTDNYPDAPGGGGAGGIEKLIGAALENAEALRQGLKDNPLAASLIGVSPELVNAPVGADLAAKQEKAKTLRERIDSLIGYIANVHARWGADHFGGVSEGQYLAHVAEQEAAVARLQNELNSL